LELGLNVPVRIGKPRFNPPVEGLANFQPSVFLEISQRVVMIATCIPDSNDIPRAINIISRSGESIGLDMGILVGIRCYRAYKLRYS